MGTNEARRSAMHIYDHKGQRKYLTSSELQAFVRSAETVPPDVRTFCETLAYTGCRLSEALALTASRVDIADGVIILESLKKRRAGVFRAVPVPPAFLERLDRTHAVRNAHRLPDRGHTIRLWSWSRTTGWRRIREVMQAAEIAGLHAVPKGLRHGFGIRAVSSQVPLNMAQKWLGHAQIATTAIYTNATGPEEKRIAERMWT